MNVFRRRSSSAGPSVPSPLPKEQRPVSERARKQREAAQAKKVSDKIDAQLEAERAALAKHNSVVKILLLGQSESGKSTVLKNFQLSYASEAFRRERVGWRGVVLLNVVRCMQRVLHALTLAQAEASERDETVNPDEPNDEPPDEAQRIAALFTENHRRLTSRLRASLDEAEQILRQRLAPGSQHQPSFPRSRPGSNDGLTDKEAGTEIFVRSRSVWSPPVNYQQLPSVGGPSTITTVSPYGPSSPTTLIDPSTSDESFTLSNRCRQDMIELWNDPAVQDILKWRKVRWQEWPGFFLNDLARVTHMDYVPTDDDVVRARLKTLGVSEYTFVIERAKGARDSFLWRVFDVGGSRTQRHTWIPFFEDATAIIFLAPISAFDQKLAEDRSVNRLEDSLLLWKSVCANKLLSKVDFILFLNKIDVLAAKLRAGVRVQKYVKSYRDRPNTTEAAAKYFKDKFHAIQREYSPLKRAFYCYLTSAIDTKATNAILNSVGESILRSHLEDAGMM